MKFSSTNGQTLGEVLAVWPPKGATTPSMVWGAKVKWREVLAAEQRRFGAPVWLRIEGGQGPRSPAPHAVDNDVFRSDASRNVREPREVAA